jgi:mannose-6-phosphate isomerase-like protein (cupin superfamily)
MLAGEAPLAYLVSASCLAKIYATFVPSTEASAGPCGAAEGRMEKVNLVDKLAHFTDHWNPKIVGELNGQQVKLVKFQGPFVWHHHEYEDELFLVVKGRFRMEFQDRHVWLEEGEFLVVPRGVEHRPVADEEAYVLLFEPASTLNTGNVRNERTLERLESI